MNQHVIELSTMDAPSHLLSVLIIDDDIELTELLSTYLQGAGYKVNICNDGQAGLSEATSGAKYDLILLDVMMPKLDGFDVLKRLRVTQTTPVLMLTARGDDYDRILGLELGADDYLPKPFNHRELLARVKAIFRRQAINANNIMGEQDLMVDDVILSPSRQFVSVKGEEIALTSSEFSILRLLMINVGQRVTKEEISQKVLGKPLQAFDRSIDMHVSNLRKKVATVSPAEKIKTIRGIGYMLQSNICVG